ncbi:uncharacterized protein RHO25_003938 [Cercospora beticola]|uniref:Thioesterase domain-containing protein n=1 Tax=Cercospora beticola TaxID=122368 RepID=A0ABZ0NID3_CERBT|nr:hypothetical protein RHO25_003938 [Cercospora beticola]CAK1360645.1 unnamed protein product [Cercospora beticola]
MVSQLQNLPDGVLTRIDMHSSLDRVNYQIESYARRSRVADTSRHEAFEELVMVKNLQVVSVDPELADSGPSKSLPVARYSVSIKPEMCSAIGQLHGAATALIFDMTTSMAVAPKARKGFWEFHGVSRNLSISYYRPVPVGSRVTIEARVVQIGNRFATIMAEMRDMNDEILASAQHDKAQVDPRARLAKM